MKAVRPAWEWRSPQRPGRRACALLGAAALLALAGCAGPAAPGGTGKSAAPRAGGAGPAGRIIASRYISFTSYPGRIQRQTPPAAFDFSPWKIISDFGLWPTRNGGIAAGDMQSLALIPPAVSAAHRAHRMMIMAVGEQGLGAAFAAGASPAHRQRLISTIIGDVTRYHFDGVDIAYAEQHGLRGTLLWQPGNLHGGHTDPRLIPLRQMVSIRG